MGTIRQEIAETREVQPVSVPWRVGQRRRGVILGAGKYGGKPQDFIVLAGDSYVRTDDGEEWAFGQSWPNELIAEAPEPAKCGKTWTGIDGGQIYCEREIGHAGFCYRLGSAKQQPPPAIEQTTPKAPEALPQRPEPAIGQVWRVAGEKSGQWRLTGFTDGSWDCYSEEYGDGAIPPAWFKDMVYVSGPISGQPSPCQCGHPGRPGIHSPESCNPNPFADGLPNPATPARRGEPDVRPGSCPSCGFGPTVGMVEVLRCLCGWEKPGWDGRMDNPAPSPGAGLAMDFGYADKAVEVKWIKNSSGELRVEAVRDLPRDNDGCLCYDCGEEMVYEGRGRYVCEECPSGSGGRQGGKEPASSPAQTRCGLRTRSGIPCDLLPHQHKGRPCQVLPKTKLEEGLMKRREMSEADIEREARWPR